MAQKTVYGIQDNKCLVEMYDKETINIKSSMPVSSRGYIFIGDSYGDGYTPDGSGGEVGWCDRLKSKMINCHANANNIFVNHKGGACFSNPQNDYLTLLKGVENQIPNKNIITDVLVGGGYNELPYRDQKEKVQGCINTLIDYVKSTYPNAVVHFAPFGVAFKNRNDQYALKYKLLPMYITISAYSHQPYMVVPGAENILSLRDMMSSDGIHPNSWGLSCIAEYLKGYLMGTGNNMQEKRQLSVRMNGGTFNGTIYGQSFGDINIYRLMFDTGVNNLNSYKANGFKIYTPHDGDAFPWRAPNFGFTSNQAIIYGNNGWHTVPVRFNVTNNNELYMQIFQTNSSNSDYESYSNITNIQLDAWIVAENI